jgi:hypothetical protein
MGIKYVDLQPPVTVLILFIYTHEILLITMLLDLIRCYTSVISRVPHKEKEAI